jgi:hypothetical protein
MFFHLVLFGFYLPVGGVGVAPLGADDHVGGGEAASCQPGTEEGFGTAVGAGGVEVAHAGGPGRIQHVVGVAFHRRDGNIFAQVLGVAQVNVAGAA